MMSNCRFLSQLQTAIPFRSQWNPTGGYNDQSNYKPTTEQIFWGFQRISSKTKWLSEMPQEVIGFPIYMELEGGLAQFVEGQLLTWGEFSCNQYAAYFQPVIPHLFP